MRRFRACASSHQGAPLLHCPIASSAAYPEPVRWLPVGLATMGVALNPKWATTRPRSGIHSGGRAAQPGIAGTEPPSPCHVTALQSGFSGPRQLCLTNFIHHGLMGPTPVVNSGTWSVGFNDEASVSCSVLNGVQSLSFSSFQEALAMQCPPVPALWLLSFFHLDLLHTSPNTVPSTISTTSHLPVTLHCGLELKSFLYFESRKQLCQVHGGSDPM